MTKSFPLSGNTALFLLIAVNALPIAGVLFWEWNVFEIVSLYWFENVVIGVINILKMLIATGAASDANLGSENGFKRENPEMPGYLRNPMAERAVNHGVKLFLVPFFTVHYGMFCLVHGIFVFTLLGGNGGEMMSGGPFSEMSKMVSQIFESGGKWFVVAIIGSHFFSFCFNYIGKREYSKTSAPALMAAPYGRIVMLHVAILFGAVVITALGSPVFLLLLLILGKIFLDAKLHLRSHRKLEDINGK